MADVLDGLSEEERAALEETPQPRWTAPMLATLHDEPFSDPDWIYERKLDGVRLLAFRQDRQVRLMSRNQQDRSATWFEIRDVLEDQDVPDCVMDGEVVAFSGNVSSFRRRPGTHATPASHGSSPRFSHPWARSPRWLARPR